MLALISPTNRLLQTWLPALALPLSMCSIHFYPRISFDSGWLTRDAAVVPSEWDCRTFEGWHFSAHPDAHVCDLLASDGTPIGWVIEPIAYLSGSGGSVPTSNLTLAVSKQPTSAEIERALHGRDERGRGNGDGLHGCG